MATAFTEQINVRHAAASSHWDDASQGLVMLAAKIETGGKSVPAEIFNVQMAVHRSLKKALGLQLQKRCGASNNDAVAKHTMLICCH